MAAFILCCEYFTNGVWTTPDDEEPYYTPLGRALWVLGVEVEVDSGKEFLDIAESLSPDAPSISAFDTEMRQINPDDICWIRIDGIRVDYPVVRGSDNERYLHTSFSGEENILGTRNYRECHGDGVETVLHV
jgi:hypothetical protein